jgi:Na+-translocating ferredoxin:NAD+ oxidoreductase subunit B
MPGRNEKAEHAAGRRRLLAEGTRAAGILAIGGTFGALVSQASPARATVWQIDPTKCTQCGRCATDCVLKPSAVRLVRDFAICGYCKFCFGFFKTNQPTGQNEGAENQRCPAHALLRQQVEGEYFEYKVIEEQCIGCGICVEGCTRFGNGSMYLQIRHHLCVNCNQCAIAAACPAQAISRVPADRPYNLRAKESSK